MAERFQTRGPTGAPAWREGTTQSTGPDNSGEIIALNSQGHVDSSMLPPEVENRTEIVAASETIPANSLVNYHYDPTANARMVRLADNSNNRPAQGFVIAGVAQSENATVYDLGEFVTSVTGTTGNNVYLGNNGQIINAALDINDIANANRLFQTVGYYVAQDRVGFEYSEGEMIE